MPTEIRVALAYKFKEFEAEKARERQLAGVKIEQTIEQETLAQCYAKVDNDTRDIIEVSKGKTLEVIAQKAGVSTRTVEQYNTIQQPYLTQCCTKLGTKFGNFFQEDKT